LPKYIQIKLSLVSSLLSKAHSNNPGWSTLQKSVYWFFFFFFNF